MRRASGTGARHGVGLLLALLAFLLPACGNDEPSYSERVTTVVRAHAAAIERHQATTRTAAAADPVAAAAGLAALAGELEALAGEVEALEVPPDRRAAAGHLVDAYGMLARAALGLRTALLDRDAEAARTAQTDYAAAAGQEREAAAALGAEEARS